MTPHPTPPTPPAVLFDMDGTLLQLTVDIEEVRLRIAALFEPLGIRGPFRPVLGRLTEAAAEAGRQGADAKQLERAGRRILDEAEVAAAAAARARPGAADTIATLVMRGVRVGLVTDNGRACVKSALRAAAIPAGSFAVIVTRDDVPAPKPDPAGILAAAAALRPADVRWYVGDHPKDVRAGRSAAARLRSLRVAAVRGGLAPAEELERAGADALLAGLDGVLALPGIPT